MEYQARWFTFTYNWLVLVPKWMLVLISGSLGSVLISVMHKASPAPKPKAKPIAPVQSSATATPAKSTKPNKAATPAPATESEREASAPPAKRTSARQRKAAKH